MAYFYFDGIFTLISVDLSKALEVNPALTRGAIHRLTSRNERALWSWEPRSVAFRGYQCKAGLLRNLSLLQYKLCIGDCVPNTPLAFRWKLPSFQRSFVPRWGRGVSPIAKRGKIAFKIWKKLDYCRRGPKVEIFTFFMPLISEKCPSWNVQKSYFWKHSR